MNPTLLHRLWSLVDISHPRTLSAFSDGDLARWLVQQLQAEQSLSHQEINDLSEYIQSRSLLIREM